MDREESERIASAQRLVGQLVGGRYELRRLIAGGASGQVFEATQAGLGRRVALKLVELQSGERDQAELRRRVSLEAETLARLAHPNVVSIFDVGDWRGRPYLVMELLDGRTLSEVIDQARRLPLGRLIPIARQICRALEATHRAGVIHRDLKPGNIMLIPFGDEAEHVKLVDFGVVKDMRAAAESTIQGTLLGTPRYMAPEQITSDTAAIGPASDLYSLGAILYRAALGREVFPQAQGMQQLVAHVRQAVPGFDQALPGHGLSAAFERLVLRCLAKRPEERFRSARELEAALAEIEAGLGPSDHVTPAVVLPPSRGSLSAHDRTLFTLQEPVELTEVEELEEVTLVGAEPARRSVGFAALWVGAALVLGSALGLGFALRGRPTEESFQVPAAAMATLGGPTAELIAPIEVAPPSPAVAVEGAPAPKPAAPAVSKPAPRPEPKAERRVEVKPTARAPKASPEPAPTAAQEAPPASPVAPQRGSDLKNPWGR